MCSNKLFILLTVVGVVILTSCGKGPEETPEEVHDTSLAETVWGWGPHRYEAFPDGWGKAEEKMTFTAATVDFFRTDIFNGEDISWGFSGTYTYHPPVIRITVTSPEDLKGMVNIGTIKKETIELLIRYDKEDKDRMEMKILDKQ